MKKMMFNDRYGLTQAVLDGRKTMTRRFELDEEFQNAAAEAVSVCYRGPSMVAYGRNGEIIARHVPRFQYGEIVAVAQSYRSIADRHPDVDSFLLQIAGGDFDKLIDLTRLAGWQNKMNVRPALMPHQVSITGIRCERLQEISSEDCLREGVRYLDEVEKYYFERKGREGFYFDTPREAFAELIDRVAERGTWKADHYAVVYEFRLIK